MKEINDYGEVFKNIVQKTSEYLINNNIKAMILGISGGIDSTVCAAICHEVSKRINIPLIGRSLPTAFNKKDEISSADLVGKYFCNDYKEINIQNWYTEISDQLFYTEKTPRKIICNGNIQARLRMMYLYDLAGNNDGIVIDTDNLTENNLGYFTIHGDVGDFNPIGGLWKTEVFKLAEWISRTYWKENMEWLQEENFNKNDPRNNKGSQAIAIAKSLALKPTAGLGITNNDLEEIGAESYEQVDYILQEILAWKWLSEKRGDTFGLTWTMRDAFLEEQQMLDMPIKVIIAVTDRHFKSEFKRNKLPIKINREEII
jgi:NAD+ synthetase